MVEDMNFKQLRYFTVIAEEKQITAAAKRLFVAQPALSYQLKQMEEELNVKLFTREPYGIELTDAGRIFYNYAQQILALSKNAKTEIKQIEDGNFGSIKVGSVSSSVGSQPSEKMIIFAKQHPNVSFDIIEDNTYGILEKLKNQLIDLALVRTPFNHTNLNSKDIVEEPMVAITQQDYFSGKSKVTIKDLANKPLVIYRRFENMFIESFSRRGYQPNFAVKCDDARTAILWCDKGLGIALVPESIAKTYAEGEVYEIEAASWRTHLQLVWRKDQVVTPLMQQIIDLY